MLIILWFWPFVVSLIMWQKFAKIAVFASAGAQSLRRRLMMCLVAKSIAPGPSSLSHSHIPLSAHPQRSTSILFGCKMISLARRASTAGCGDGRGYIWKSIVILFNNNNTAVCAAKKKLIFHFCGEWLLRLPARIGYWMICQYREKTQMSAEFHFIILISRAFVLDSELWYAGADGVSAFDICFAF